MTSQPANLADPVLLEKIDKFFELGIGEYVALPQLLVVGDQSSGKSSVLEGLTGLPYPRDSGLCTRFATHITFRRSPTAKITVSIIPAENADSEYADRLRAWRKEDLVSLELQSFSDILKEVQELMGLGEANTGSHKKTFADDVLKIEMCGPDQEHLSVIDVPGIFKKSTPGVTTKADMVMVRNMVTTYMRNPRSVILAVIPANVDIATQEILEMAGELDVRGERTLGVLTKPDLVDKGAESAVVDIIEGRSHALNLGWCIVRNPGQQALAISQSNGATTDRYATEKAFFKNEQPWSDISKDHVGIQALRTRLVDILADMIKREFPRVKAEISSKLKLCKHQLDALGPSRGTRDQQYKFLLELATRYQTITSLALKAHYGGDDVFESTPSLKLATAIVSRNTSFANDMWHRGHAMAFHKEKDLKENNPSPSPAPAPASAPAPAPFGRPSPFVSQVPGAFTFNAANSDTSKAKPPTNTPEGFGNQLKTVRYMKNHEDLVDIVQEDSLISPPQVFRIKQWLENMYESSRGFELGTFDASLLPIIWRKQSANWEALALGYVDDIVSLVHKFTLDLLAEICKDPRARQGLHSVLLDQLTDRYKKSIEHTKFLLVVERSGTPMTMNHYFADNLEKSRSARMKAAMEKVATWDPNQGKVVKLEAILNQGVNTGSNLKHTVDDLHDILHSYYKVARKRFVDIICMQAADHFLVTGQDAPIKVFSPKFVSELTTEQLEAIAGEDLVSKRKREDLKRKIENLEMGKKIALA